MLKLITLSHAYPLNEPYAQQIFPMKARAIQRLVVNLHSPSQWLQQSDFLLVLDMIQLANHLRDMIYIPIEPFDFNVRIDNVMACALFSLCRPLPTTLQQSRLAFVEYCIL